ncbi:MAG: hypothetical protein COA44_01200 [Arcobacter sp.]|nr:MAG: hypothetical protein COA44_01200 [Arcobacter sp.]
MTKLILALVTLSLLSLNISADVISKVKKTGELVLGTSGTMTPMTRALDDGSAVGLDIDIAKTMAAALNAKLVIKVIAFNKLIPALKNGEIDMIISNMTITPKRNTEVAFVGPYMTSGKCLVTKLTTLALAKDAKALKQSAKKMAVIKDTTSERFVRALMPKIELQTVTSQEDAVKLVIDDEVEALLTDYPVCMSILQSNPEAGFVSAFSKLTYEPIGIALPANDTHFINWTENFLQRATQTGLLNAFGHKWLGETKL